MSSQDMDQPQRASSAVADGELRAALRVRELAIHAGASALLEVPELTIPEAALTALVGPSGSGKTTFLRSLNRLGEECDGLTVRGHRELLGRCVTEFEAPMLRRAIGMVFQKPCMFPGSILANVVFGLRHLGLIRRRDERERARRELDRVGLLEEVGEDLDRDAMTLSVGQQQRLCLARALALEPAVLLLDEPTSALDPRSTGVIEDLLAELKGRRCIVLVTHSLDQARRLADHLVVFEQGRLIESGPAPALFASPGTEEARRYLGPVERAG